MYCVFNSEGDIIGRFKMYNRAIEYVLKCKKNRDREDLKIQEMTKEEFYKYVENLIKNT